jgi:hypothetical protein
MARYIPIGSPVNRSEEDGIRALRDALPEGCVVIGNFELQLPRRKNTLEYDALVIGDHGVYAVEIKGWGGRISGDIRRWTLEWGRVENPLIHTEAKAKALRDVLARQLPEWPDGLFCEAVVLLARPSVELQLEDARRERVITTSQIEAFFVERARRVEEGEELVVLGDALRQRIVDALVPMAHPARGLIAVPGYEIEEELDRRPQARYRDFIGRHRMLKSRGRVRIKAYTVDPLTGSTAWRGVINRTLRDMEALQVLDGNPYVARAYEMLQDQEDELVFYMVSEWVGSETLEEYIAEGGGASGWQRWHYMAELCRAVSAMHKAGIVHRGLHPGVVYLQPEGADVAVKVADFDFARVDMLDSIAGELGEIGRDGYAAPELLLGGGNHDERVDVFSVGAILYELITGHALYEDVTWVLRHREIWPRQRLLVSDPELRVLLDGLLALRPEDRHPNLDEARRVCEERLAAEKERG